MKIQSITDLASPILAPLCTDLRRSFAAATRRIANELAASGIHGGPHFHMIEAEATAQVHLRVGAVVETLERIIGAWAEPVDEGDLVAVFEHYEPALDDLASTLRDVARVYALPAAHCDAAVAHLESELHSHMAGGAARVRLAVRNRPSGASTVIHNSGLIGALQVGPNATAVIQQGPIHPDQRSTGDG